MRVERESSNSLFEVLEGWEAYLQGENIDLNKLSLEVDNESKSKTDSVKKSETSNKARSQVKAKRPAQRLVP